MHKHPIDVDIFVAIKEADYKLGTFLEFLFFLSLFKPGLLLLGLCKMYKCHLTENTYFECVVEGPHSPWNASFQAVAGCFVNEI